jgi:hypothetical protein
MVFHNKIPPAIIPIPNSEKLRLKKPCFSELGDFPFYRGYFTQFTF